MSDTRVTPLADRALIGATDRGPQIRISGSIGIYHTNPSQILAQRGSQRALRAPLRTSTPTPAATTAATGKAPTVRLRLHGTPAEVAVTLTALAEMLDLHTVSRTYPDRPPSTWHRVYIDAAPRQTTEESK